VPGPGAGPQPVDKALGKIHCQAHAEREDYIAGLARLPKAAGPFFPAARRRGVERVPDPALAQRKTVSPR
jgi:hypothetical protein